MLRGHYRYALIAFNRPRLELGAALLAAVTAVGLAAAVAPVYGGKGAALALVAGSLVNGAAAWLFAVRKLGPLPFRPHIARAVVAAGVSLALWAPLRDRGEIMAAVAGIGVFGMLFLILEPGLWRRRR